MAPSTLLFLDLGDLFTKGLAEGAARRRFRFPSAVAHRLLNDETSAGELVLDHEAVPRPTGFDPGEHPRARSYPGCEHVRAGIAPVPGARFAGWLAAAFGRDRELLGVSPSEQNIDALVRKSFLECGAPSGKATVVFVVDTGAKADALFRYAKSPPAARFLAWNGKNGAKPRRVELEVTGHVVDSAACAAAALPAEVSRDGPVLLVDIGYFRTKLAIISADGCLHQEELDGVGVANCVRRILRDEQDQRLVGDEFAVIRAFEQSHGSIEVAGQRFDIRRTLLRARRTLEQELARAIERALVERASTGDACRALAIVGGGASLAGKGLLTRVVKSKLGPTTTWVATDTRFMLVRGARRLHSLDNR